MVFIVKSWQAAAAYALGSRLLLAALCVLAAAVLPTHQPTGAAYYPNTGFDSTASSISTSSSISIAERSYAPLPMGHWSGRWLVGFTRWDSAHFLSLAQYGYQPQPLHEPRQFAFYPMFPAVVQWIVQVFLQGQGGAASSSSSSSSSSAPAGTGADPNSHMYVLVACAVSALAYSAAAAALFQLLPALLRSHAYLHPRLVPPKPKPEPEQTAGADTNSTGSIIVSDSDNDISGDARRSACLLAFLCCPASVFSVQPYTESAYAALSFGALLLTSAPVTNANEDADANAGGTCGSRGRGWFVGMCRLALGALVGVLGDLLAAALWLLAGLTRSNNVLCAVYCLRQMDRAARAVGAATCATTTAEITNSGSVRDSNGGFSASAMYVCLRVVRAHYECALLALHAFVFLTPALVWDTHTQSCVGPPLQVPNPTGLAPTILTGGQWGLLPEFPCAGTSSGGGASGSESAVAAVASVLTYLWLNREVLLLKVLSLPIEATLRLIDAAGTGLLLPAYSALQAEYWGVQFLGQWLQWPPRQLPNILLGLPILAIGAAIVTKTAAHVRERVNNCYCCSALDLEAASAAKSNKAKKVTLAPTATENGTKVAAVGAVLGCLWREAVRHVEVLHLALLCLVGALWAHVQVSTRLLCFSCPVLYVYVGGELVQSGWWDTDTAPPPAQGGKEKEEEKEEEEENCGWWRHLCVYASVYLVCGVVLHPTFSPWT